MTTYSPVPRNRALNIGEFKDGKPQQVLPRSLVEAESELAAFHKSCHDLMLKILTLFGVGLEVCSPLFPS